MVTRERRREGGREKRRRGREEVNLKRRTDILAILAAMIQLGGQRTTSCFLGPLTSLFPPVRCPHICRLTPSECAVPPTPACRTHCYQAVLPGSKAGTPDAQARSLSVDFGYPQTWCCVLHSSAVSHFTDIIHVAPQSGIRPVRVASTCCPPSHMYARALCSSRRV